MSLRELNPNRKRDPQTLVEEGTLDFTLGDLPSAVRKINEALTVDPEFFPAHHALAEIYFSARDLPKALAAATKAHQLQPGDIHINTSLSRIYMEMGDKAQAEHFGAKARMLGWLGETFYIGDLAIDLTASIGVGLTRSATAKGLLHAAGLAMYEAKSAGRGRIHSSTI